MPELPEVEIVRSGLHRAVSGQTFADAQILHDHFKPGRQRMPVGLVQYVRRHGKWLLFRIATDSLTVVAVNLGMSGRFSIDALKEIPKHTRWRVLLENGGERAVLNYVDPRCMGRLKILEGADAVFALSDRAASRGIFPLNLGPDWLSPAVTNNSSSGLNVVRDALCDTPREIKRVLLEQSRLAGLGNIYASEACFLARVRPDRPAESLTRQELKRLHSAVPTMLREAIKRGGTSLGDANSYVDVTGRAGTYVERLRVYGRGGKPCRGGCRGDIVKTTLGGRSTFYCSKCQS